MSYLKPASETWTTAPKSPASGPSRSSLQTSSIPHGQCLCQNLCKSSSNNSSCQQPITSPALSAQGVQLLGISTSNSPVVECPKSPEFGCILQTFRIPQQSSPIKIGANLHSKHKRNRNQYSDPHCGVAKIRNPDQRLTKKSSVRTTLSSGQSSSYQAAQNYPSKAVQVITCKLKKLVKSSNHQNIHDDNPTRKRSH